MCLYNIKLNTLSSRQHNSVLSDPVAVQSVDRDLAVDIFYALAISNFGKAKP